MGIRITVSDVSAERAGMVRHAVDPVMAAPQAVPAAAIVDLAEGERGQDQEVPRKKKRRK